MPSKEESTGPSRSFRRSASLARWQRRGYGCLCLLLLASILALSALLLLALVARGVFLHIIESKRWFPDLPLWTGLVALIPVVVPFLIRAYQTARVRHRELQDQELKIALHWDQLDLVQNYGFHLLDVKITEALVDLVIPARPNAPEKETSVGQIQLPIPWPPEAWLRRRQPAESLPQAKVGPEEELPATDREKDSKPIVQDRAS